MEPRHDFLKSELKFALRLCKSGTQESEDLLKEVKTAWNKIEPNSEFLGSFRDENIDRNWRKNII